MRREVETGGQIETYRHGEWDGEADRQTET